MKYYNNNNVLETYQVLKGKVEQICYEITKSWKYYVIWGGQISCFPAARASFCFRPRGRVYWGVDLSLSSPGTYDVQQAGFRYIPNSRKLLLEYGVSIINYYTSDIIFLILKKNRKKKDKKKRKKKRKKKDKNKN